MLNGVICACQRLLTGSGCTPNLKGKRSGPRQAPRIILAASRGFLFALIRATAPSRYFSHTRVPCIPHAVCKEKSRRLLACPKRSF
jgi:hypothetical protein